MKKVMKMEVMKKSFSFQFSFGFYLFFDDYHSKSRTKIANCILVLDASTHVLAEARRLPPGARLQFQPTGVRSLGAAHESKSKNTK